MIRKYRDKYYPRIFNFPATRSKMQKYETLMQHRENKKHIQSTRRFFNNYLGTMKSKIYIGSLEFETQKTINDMICVSNKEIYKTELIRQNTAYNMGKLDTKNSTKKPLMSSDPKSTI